MCATGKANIETSNVMLIVNAMVRDLFKQASFLRFI
jgi:hypothetical protein